ncbi:hypothetical protein ACFZDK_54740 [Streptomyces sp. NPDC007901]|uniref:hypothetical protein n=1 Tax=Streptomyces sp. NPDC007901 TaxID=3364785 RepID=UPI0036E2EE37
MFFFDLASDEQARAVLAEREERAVAHHARLTELGAHWRRTTDRSPPTAVSPSNTACGGPRWNGSGPAGPPNSSAERRRRHAGRARGPLP